MPKKILIVGGTGRIGLAVAGDIAAHSDAHLLLTGRNREKGTAVAEGFNGRAEFLPLDLNSVTGRDLIDLARQVDLVVQCTGPFRTLPPSLLEAAIAAGTNYVDVCDDAEATKTRLTFHKKAQEAGITALIDTGTFPGIDNVLVADALARYPEAKDVRLYFLCAGSGDGGFGVLETTFIAVSRPYLQLHQGRWESTPSYRGRQTVDFGPPIGRCPVYNFEVPELWSLAHTFPQLETCTSKFGTRPAIWNWATTALASAPKRVRTNREFLHNGVRFMLPIVHWIDRWVGGELGIRVEVRTPLVQDVTCFYAPSTSEAVGWATGVAALMVLNGEISDTGVLLPETHIPPQLYINRLVERGGTLTHFENKPMNMEQ
ncbi:MAG: saccharopine dehydrogenase NADP-binding domain-containing protein [Ardenticatenaceae bacterium]|nr:saccharopine dehydrogenase NADP-binding domain-containing protein [Ardenticatenaceae bacterium]